MFSSLGWSWWWVWARIECSINIVHEKCTIPLNTLRKNVGDRRDMRFWMDIWVGVTSFMVCFDRLFALE